MSGLPSTDNVPVVRTDFSDDQAWKQLCKEMTAPIPFDEHVVFHANLSFIDDEYFEGMQIEEIVSSATSIEHPILCIADGKTLTSADHPILCVDLMEQPGRNFRFIPSQSWSVENNLSLANMDFEEFQQMCDEDGIFRIVPGMPGESAV